MSQLTADSAAELSGVLRRACESVGLDSAGAELVRYTVNAVYILSSQSVAVRLRKGGRAAVARTAMVARWLAARGAPIAPLFPEHDQPVEIDDYSVTFWVAASRNKERWQGADLASPLKAIHRLSPPPDLPEWNPFLTIRSRIKKANWVSGDDRAWLSRECDELEVAYGELLPTLQQGLIHGDAHLGNLLRDRSGQVVLCDLDSVARGPLIQDLIPIAANATRFGQVLRHRTLAYAYGFDVMRHPAWPVFRRIRDVMTTAAGLANAEGRPAVAEQAAYRLHTLRAGDVSARWRAYNRA